jgi:hypothetical protein
MVCVRGRAACMHVCCDSNEGLLGKTALINFLWEKLGYVKSDAYGMYITEE